MARIIRAALLHFDLSGECFPEKPPKAQGTVKAVVRTLRQKD
jgi:hypothetical protein